MSRLVDFSYVLKGGRMKKLSNLEMFIFAFVLSAFSFGGGYITIPVLKKKLVDEKEVLSEGTLQNLAAIAQSAPGSISVSLASGLAYEIGGVKMMLFTFIASILPPLIIITLVAIFYDAFMNHAVIQSIFRGLEIGVAVIMVILVKDMLSALLRRDHKIAVLLLIVSIVLNFLLRTHVVFILIFNVAMVFVIYNIEGKYL